MHKEEEDNDNAQQHDIQFTGNSIRDHLSMVFGFDQDEKDDSNDIALTSLQDDANDIHMSRAGIGSEVNNVVQVNEKELRMIVKRKEAALRDKKRKLGAFDGIQNELSTWNNANTNNDDEEEDKSRAFDKRQRKRRNPIQNFYPSHDIIKEKTKPAPAPSKKEPQPKATVSPSVKQQQLKITKNSPLKHQQPKITETSAVKNPPKTQAPNLNSSTKVKDDSKQSSEIQPEKKKKKKTRSKMKNRKKDNRPEGSWMKNAITETLT